MVTVNFTDDAKADVRAYVADPQKRVALVSDIAQGLAFFPARHKRCPPETRFGPDARFYYQGGFTVIYDLYESDTGESQDVWVRHVWPATSMRAAGLLM